MPERTLLMWAFFDGAMDGKLGQFLVRHKTRKEPFRTWMNVWLVGNGVLYSTVFFAPFLGTPLSRSGVN